MKRSAAFLLWASLAAGTPHWLELTGPILTSAEKKAYVSMTPAEQDEFEKQFWDDTNLSSREYLERVEYVDAIFGSKKPGSGANTDQGRVYLALGPPKKATRFPSSRIFVPLEIWYYEVVPGVLDTELHLIFYQKNSVGYLKLYSPNVDTVRSLLLPEAATVHMFGPNDTMDEVAIRTNLRVPPAEDEVVTAAVNVATGIRDNGNDQILGQVTSPRTMLRRRLTPGVHSRFFSQAPKLTSVRIESPFGGVQADLSIESVAHSMVKLEVFQAESLIYQSAVDLKVDTAGAVQFLYRLDLLPGSYRLMIAVDGNTFPYPFEIEARLTAGPLIRVSEARRVSGSATPFQFGERSFYPSEDGGLVLWQIPRAGEVTWSIRKNLEIVSRTITKATAAAAVFPLPLSSLPPGRYSLEASVEGEAAHLEFEASKIAGPVSSGTLVSYNANLSPAARYTLIGEQWAVRGRLAEAGAALQKALEIAPTRRAQIAMARVEALAGNWDSARDRLRPILAADPANFDALCVMAYIEAKFQDFEVAAELYHRALEVRDSPAVRMALSELHH